MIEFGVDIRQRTIEDLWLCRILEGIGKFGGPLDDEEDTNLLIPPHVEVRYVQSHYSIA